MDICDITHLLPEYGKAKVTVVILVINDVELY